MSKGESLRAPLQSQAGFSLVGLVIGAGVSVLASVLILQLMAQNQTISVALDHKTQLDQLHYMRLARSRNLNFLSRALGLIDAAGNRNAILDHCLSRHLKPGDDCSVFNQAAPVALNLGFEENDHSEATATYASTMTSQLTCSPASCDHFKFVLTTKVVQPTVGHAPASVATPSDGAGSYQSPSSGISGGGNGTSPSSHYPSVTHSATPSPANESAVTKRTDTRMSELILPAASFAPLEQINFSCSSTSVLTGINFDSRDGACMGALQVNSGSCPPNTTMTSFGTSIQCVPNANTPCTDFGYSAGGLFQTNPVCRTIASVPAVPPPASPTPTPTPTPTATPIAGSTPATGSSPTPTPSPVACSTGAYDGINACCAGYHVQSMLVSGACGGSSQFGGDVAGTGIQACITGSNTCAPNISCPSGQHVVTPALGPQSCSSTVCPSGQTEITAGVCAYSSSTPTPTPAQCPSGQHMDPTSMICFPDSFVVCPPGQHLTVSQNGGGGSAGTGMGDLPVFTSQCVADSPTPTPTPAPVSVAGCGVCPSGQHCENVSTPIDVSEGFSGPMGSTNPGPTGAVITTPACVPNAATSGSCYPVQTGNGQALVCF